MIVDNNKPELYDCGHPYTGELYECGHPYTGMQFSQVAFKAVFHL